MIAIIKYSSVNGEMYLGIILQYSTSLFRIDFHIFINFSKMQLVKYVLKQNKASYILLFLCHCEKEKKNGLNVRNISIFRLRNKLFRMKSFSLSFIF